MKMRVNARIVGSFLALVRSMLHLFRISKKTIKKRMDFPREIS